MLQVQFEIQISKVNIVKEETSSLDDNRFLQIVRRNMQQYYSYYLVMKRLNKTLNQQQISPSILPNQIASRILDLELDYDAKNLTKEDLMELLSLYSQAVQFYEQNKDKKYQVFQNRLTNVLKNPYVISILEGRSPSKIKQQQINELTKTAQTTSQFEANQLLTTFQNQQSRVQTKIEKEIQNQKNKLIRRVMNRSFNKSFTTNPQVKQRNQSMDLIEVVKPEKKEKKHPDNFLSFLDDKKSYQIPQRRKNIRAPNI